MPEGRRSDNQHSHSDHQRHDEQEKPSLSSVVSQKGLLATNRHYTNNPVISVNAVCDSYPARAELTPTNRGKRFEVRSQLGLTDAEVSWPPLLPPKQASCRRLRLLELLAGVWASGEPSKFAAALLCHWKRKRKRPEKTPSRFQQEERCYNIFVPTKLFQPCLTAPQDERLEVVVFHRAGASTVAAANR